LRLNNDGEGGILALSTLLGLHERQDGTGRLLRLVALLGAAMLFGDGIITPAISVLSAIEGLELAAPHLSHWVVPLTILVLVVLFAAQRAGTHRIGTLFGPVMLLWFTVLGVLGLISLIKSPHILIAVNPLYGIDLVVNDPIMGIAVLSAVFLTITGGEALYADLGQFGRPAIARAWFFIAMPGLLLNYFGQGALVLADQEALKNPFYLLAPEFFQFPLIVLATLATIIASQAVITGVFSMAKQAMEVGMLVRLHVQHTAAEHESHVYVKSINYILAVLAIAAVLMFESSDALADAYGIAVATAMITTTILFVAANIQLGRWPKHWAYGVGALLLTIDLIYFLPNLGKIETGGWLPLSLAGVAMMIIVAWRLGIRRSRSAFEAVASPLGQYAHQMLDQVPTVPRWGVFLTRAGDMTPTPLATLDRLLGSVFKGLVILSIRTESRPRVPPADRIKLHHVNERMIRIDLHVGYMQSVSLPSLLGPVLREQQINPDDIIYVVGHERPLPPPKIKRPQDILLTLFCMLVRNAERRADRLDLPIRRTLELGYRIQL